MKLVLATNGVWEQPDAIGEAFTVRSEDELRRLVERCARESRDDATAVLLDIR